MSYRRMEVEEARSRIIGLLNENGLIRKNEASPYCVSVHERCGKSIEIIPSRQWFIRVMDQKKRLLEAADKSGGILLHEDPLPGMG